MITPTTASRVFHNVSDAHPKEMSDITAIFHRILTPLYGSQDKAIAQIRASEDRKAFLLYEDEKPKAVLVFKKVLSDEYKSYGVCKSIEIKSLFVDDAAHNSGKGLGSALITKLFEELSILKLGEEGVHVTVSESKPESLNFFQKKGFKIVHQWQGRYQEGAIEYLLHAYTKLAA